MSSTPFSRSNDEIGGANSGKSLGGSKGEYGAGGGADPDVDSVLERKGG